jgi:hypothetical protein
MTLRRRSIEDAIWRYAEIEYGRDAAVVYNDLMAAAHKNAPSLWTRIKTWAKQAFKAYDPDIAYLERSVDRCDFESRIERLRHAGRM